MLADLDLLLTAVFVTADDLLPEKAKNAKRTVTDAEVVTLAVAQAITGIDIDRKFLAVAARRLDHLFPKLPKQSGYWKATPPADRDDRLADRRVRRRQPRTHRPSGVVGLTPVECGRSLETARCSQLADACGSGCCKSHSRWFWGVRLHLLAAPDGTPRAATSLPPTIKNASRCASCHSACAAATSSSATRLRRQRLRDHRHRTLRRADPAPRPQNRVQHRTAPRPDPPMHRIDLLDPQGPPRPRTPQRPHPRRPARPHHHQTPRPRRRRLAQPPPRTPEPPIRRPRPLTQRGINHLGRSPSLKRRPAGLRECVHLQPEYALSLRELAQVLRGVVYSCAP